MIAFSNAKINLALYITGKRNDGYHHIESIFLPIKLQDAIEVIPAKENSIHIYGSEIPGNIEQNSCLKALHLLQKSFQIGNYEIHLLKKTPIGAGLGGGSSNSSEVLKLLNEYENLQLSKKELKTFALQLGSDNAFFIENCAKYVSGRGEVMKNCAIDLSNYKVVVIFPKIHRSTAKAYKNIHFSNIDFDLGSLSTEEFLANPYQLKNSFQDSFLREFPETEAILVELKHAKPVFASLTGSGSAFYGIFEPESEIPTSLSSFASENHYQYLETTIL